MQTTAPAPTTDHLDAQTSTPPDADLAVLQRPGRRLGAAVRVSTALAAFGVLAFSILGPHAGDPAAALCGPEGCDYTPTEEKPHRPGNRAAQIVTIGDSYASGEGAPDRAANNGGLVWQDANCHRSGFAQSNRAVNILRSTNPYAEGINFLNVACSGAGVVDGVLNGQAGRNIPAQIDQVNSALGTRRVDILHISAGGNDLNFGALVKECIETTCPGRPTRLAYEAAIAALPERYDRLIDAVQGTSSGHPARLKTPVAKVFVTKYPGPMRNANSGYCDRQPWYDPSKGITWDESRWGTLTVVAQLNDQIDAMVARANARPGTHPTWVAVTPPSFERNGFCAEDSRFINNVGDSYAVQSDERGTMHPNYTGTGHLGRNLYDQWRYINA